MDHSLSFVLVSEVFMSSVLTIRGYIYVFSFVTVASEGSGASWLLIDVTVR